MQAIALALLAVFHALGPAAGGGSAQTERRPQGRLEEALRREEDALVAMADAAVAGRGVPATLTLTWRNDFFKAQPGTFVPFTITFDPAGLSSQTALLYVRVDRHEEPGTPARRRRAAPAYETIFPVRIGGAQPARITRGFAVPAGRYQVVVALRETPDTPSENMPERKAGTLIRLLDVPDFWTGELAISTIMLADGVQPLDEAVPADELDEHPYVIGTHRIHLAAGSAFPRNRELVVVFLVYNPSVAIDKHFDVQVDYHLYRKNHPQGQPSGGSSPEAGAAGERYVTRTNPQRFNPSMMGAAFDPAAGTPILAGQGILLANFEPGAYRLEIKVTDLLSRKSLSRDVAFTVVGL